MDRRHFSLSAMSLVASAPRLFAQNPQATDILSVGVIGHTGRGNYGHGLDTVWQRVPRTSIVCVADADKEGLEKQRRKLNLDASAGYRDYREMLRAVRPDIVAVCPRYLDQHRDMIVAAIESGAKGIYVEKPFVRTPREADDVLAACAKHGTKVAVAHRNRYHPALQTIDRLIDEGRIGRLLEIRGRGKGDRRGGAEDLWVLGSHVLNLVTYFGGPPESCSAVLLQDGRRVSKADVVEGAEGLGPLAGNELHARFMLTKGVTAMFDSIANDGTKNFGFGLQLIGSDGIIAIRCDASPLAHLVPGNPFQPTETPRPWLAVSSGGVDVEEPVDDLDDQLHHHVLAAADLIQSIDEDRQPRCSAAEASTTVDMICGVFESHRQGSRAVRFPLAERQHPLRKL